MIKTTLEILICTVDNGINTVGKILLPPAPNIRYLISWQTDGMNLEIPRELVRGDVRIITLKGKGLSRNRNNAIDHATGDICLIADDDVRYKAGKLVEIIDIFNTNQTLDIAVFKYGSSSGRKNYPDYSFDLNNMPRRYYVSSIEIAFRRSSVTGKIRFNELFGIGAPVLKSGEESIFILDALKNKLNCIYFPIEIVTHDLPTTGTKAKTPGVLMSQGAYTYFKFPKTCYLRIVKTALFISVKEHMSFFQTLKYLISGINYVKRIK